MLTENQKKLLSDLQSEFESLNITKDKSSSLVKELMDEIYSEKTTKQEVDAYNRKFLISFYDKLNKDIKDFIRFYDDNGVAFKDITLNYSLEDLIERASEHQLPTLIYIEFRIEDYRLKSKFCKTFPLKYNTLVVGDLRLNKLEGLHYYTNLIDATNNCGRFRIHLKEILSSY